MCRHHVQSAALDAQVHGAFGRGVSFCPRHTPNPSHLRSQADAKRAVAVALRNRWRRQKIKSPLKEDIVPKNILMIGPTGCGKTEIARRLAKLADAPFIKVRSGQALRSIIRSSLQAAPPLRVSSAAPVTQRLPPRHFRARAGGGHEVHRGRLPRPRRGYDHPRPRRPRNRADAPEAAETDGRNGAGGLCPTASAASRNVLASAS